MYTTGTIAKVLPVLKRQTPKGVVVTQSFILRDDKGFGHDAFFIIPDGLMANIYKIKVGDKVTVHFDIVAKEKNGTWYNNLYVWKIGAPRVYTNVIKDITPTPTKKRKR